MEIEISKNENLKGNFTIRKAKKIRLKITVYVGDSIDNEEVID